MQLIGPRRAQHWSKSYKDRAADLIADGRMHPAGLAAIESSKHRRLWDVMDDVDALIAPNDLVAALDRDRIGPTALRGVPAMDQAQHAAQDQSGQDRGHPTKADRHDHPARC